ncbi:MAG: pseudouridine synthase, partial [Acutalibacteraceae bacterium]
MKILYSDKDIVALIKPVGMDSEREVPEKIKEQICGDVFTVHRLDKNVGGVMVYARNRITAAALSKTIQQGEMIKEYVALVHGAPPESGVLEDLLFKDS